MIYAKLQINFKVQIYCTYNVIRDIDSLALKPHNPILLTVQERQKKNIMESDTIYLE